ncbi:MAG: CvpA family protein [Chitinophagaceae bacterium]|nr:CvpA family protein [Chitinophagaceae bacterium]
MLIDFTFAALLILAIIKGYQKGLILAIFSIIAFIIGLAAALKLSTAVAAYLKDSISVSAKWMPFIAFALVFFIVVILVRLGAKLIEKTFQAVMLGWLNRIGGILLYAALYLIILSIFIFYAEKLQLLQPEAIKSSQTYPFIQPWGPKVMDSFGKLIPVFKDMFTELGDFFNSLSNKIQH